MRTYAVLNMKTGGDLQVHREHCHDIGTERNRHFVNNDWTESASTPDALVSEMAARFANEGITGLAIRVMPCARKAAR